MSRKTRKLSSSSLKDKNARISFHLLDTDENQNDYINGKYDDGGEVEILSEDYLPENLSPNARGSIGSGPTDLSHRGSAGSLSNAERFEIMTRNSLPTLQQRRQSTASAFIREPLTANTDDRNWSWTYLRERFRIKELEELFEHYLLRINHSMLIVYLLLQLFISIVFVVSLLISQNETAFIVPELTGHAATLIVCFSLLVYIYNERTFRDFPSLHIVLSGLVILTLFSTDVALTLYLQEYRGDSNLRKDVLFGNMVYVVLVVYMFLPIQRKWQVTSLAVLLSIGYLALLFYALGTQHYYNSDGNRKHLIVKMVVTALILICVNLVGIYWRFMSEVAFRRAFLDKRGNLESKFKLDAEKKREENLLLSILPKNIMQQVKADFRNLIESTLDTNPVSKNNPFPNLYVNRYEMVSILYADIVNFTPLTTKLPVDQLVEMLNDLFGKFDEASETHNCLRIKILGDCYYCVSGVPDYTEQHANNCVKVGLEMIDIIREVREERSVNVDMRIGIHSGTVLSGLIGVRKWQFDVWSNDVTIANRMEQTGKAGRVHVTHKTRELLKGLGYEFVASDASCKDPLLQNEGISTYLIVPKNRPPGKRRVSYTTTANPPRVSITTDPKELENFYEGDVAKVYRPQEGRKPSILNRRRSTYTESALSGKRRTVVTDSALTSFQNIMVNSKEFMEKAIEKMPLSKYDQWFKPEGIHPLFLTFINEKWEVPLFRQADPLYKFYILCAGFVFVCIFLIQQVLMPMNTWGWVSGSICFVLLLVVGPLCWVATIHQHIIDPHNDREYDFDTKNAITSFFYSASSFVISCSPLRATLFLVVCTVLYICAVINLVDCKYMLNEINIPGDLSTSTASVANDYRWISENASLSTTPSSPIPDELPSLCCYPWFFTYSCALLLLVAWTFFRIHFLLKLFVYILAMALYGYFIFDFVQDFYTQDNLETICPSLQVTSLGLSPGMGHLLFVFMIVLVLHIMDRQTEYIMRLDFQWKQNLEKEQKEAQTTHFANKLLLQNILPLHVAEMYLNRQSAMDELYHESYQHVGVIFASIPNYGEFYKENEMNEEGKMCLRVLNEIISDFDMLTYNAQFLTIEKIKVVGSTYMAACGLQPGRRYSDDSDFEERDKKDNVATITRFAAAMFEKLNMMNDEDLQDFKLRVGIDVGPVIAGVVGAHKPMYDIWGNTVNVASRMDYTGEEGKIHVTSEVGEILQDLGWKVDCRGEIYVKGKGPMTTYFVDPTSVPEMSPEQALSNNNSNNNNNSNYNKNRRESETSERRRSSQLSLSSLKGLLSSHRGSLDISKNKDSVSQSGTTSILKVMKKCRGGGGGASSSSESAESSSSPSSSSSAGNSPRSSVDSRGTDSQTHNILHLPSPVEEENGDLCEEHCNDNSPITEEVVPLQIGFMDFYESLDSHYPRISGRRAFLKVSEDSESITPKSSPSLTSKSKDQNVSSDPGGAYPLVLLNSENCRSQTTVSIDSEDYTDIRL